MSNTHVNLAEKNRLESLHEYPIFNALSESEFENIAVLVATICQTPFCFISMIDKDKQWYITNKSSSIQFTKRIDSFCHYTIDNNEDIMIVKDARLDPIFKENPYVIGSPHIVFYAGVKLVNSQGFALGSLCIVDTKPRDLNDQQKLTLTSLAKQIILILELKRKNIELEESRKKLKDFSYVISHDLKAPINQIISLSDLMVDEIKDANKVSKLYLSYISNASNSLKDMVEGILLHHISNNKELAIPVILKLKKYLNNIIALIPQPKHCIIETDLKIESLLIYQILLKQVLLNLISNAIKYNDKDQIKIQISVDYDAEKKHSVWEIKDNGIGIKNENKDKIFTKFETLDQSDRYSNKGTGIGLATVKDIIEHMEGSISLRSEHGEGSIFSLKLPILMS